MHGGLASLDEVRTEVAVERGAQLAHFDSMDAKAGVILGFAGVLAATAPSGISAPLIGGRMLAVSAALLALLGFWPRGYPVAHLRVLRDDYLASEVRFTRIRILDTKIVMIERTSAIFARKALLLRLAMLALAGSILFVSVGKGLG